MTGDGDSLGSMAPMLTVYGMECGVSAVRQTLSGTDARTTVAHLIMSMRRYRGLGMIPELIQRSSSFLDGSHSGEVEEL
jgi:hypothetical protein